MTTPFSLPVGHRGWPFQFPPNTLRGFAAAWDAGCRMVECDVRPAKDGVLVLAHDPHVSDKTGTRYLVSDYTARELAALDLGKGAGVPTLQALSDWAAQTGCAVMADMKCEGSGIEEAVVAALAPLSVSQKIVPGAGRASRDKFRAIDPVLPLSLSLGKNAPELQSDAAFESLLAALDTRAVTWEWQALTPHRLSRLHEKNIFVFAWTVDDADEMRRLKDMGVDGIISKPRRLVSAL